MANVIPIDLVHSGYDARGKWPAPAPRSFPAARFESDPLNPARGCITGLIVSGLMWIGIIGAACWLWSLR